MLGYDYHPAAEDEYHAAIRDYSGISRELGLSFVREIERAVEKARQFPESQKRITGNVRRVLTQRFSYSVVYEVLENKVLIWAIAHASREPGYWLLPASTAGIDLIDAETAKRFVYHGAVCIHHARAGRQRGLSAEPSLEDRRWLGCHAYHARERSIQRGNDVNAACIKLVGRTHLARGIVIGTSAQTLHLRRKLAGDGDDEVFHCFGIVAAASKANRTFRAQARWWERPCTHIRTTCHPIFEV